MSFAIKLGLIKERKVPVDHRVPFSPSACVTIAKRFPFVSIIAEASDVRCYKDDEYRKAGITVSSDISNCDIIMGVKEPSISDLIPGKTYCLFSHTIKKQPYNRKLLQAMLSNNIRLIDYECLQNAGAVIGAFSRFAGIVGAYNGLRAFGLRTKSFDLRAANKCENGLSDLQPEVKKIPKNKPIKILLVGAGRAGKGAKELLKMAKITEAASEADFLNAANSSPMFLQVDCDSYVKRKDGKEFSFEDYFSAPDKYERNFARFLSATDLLIVATFWDPKAPVLFTMDDIRDYKFNIKVIADVTCDIEGSVPTTIRSTTIADPVFDLDLKSLKEVKPFSGDMTVMSVDNLPCELPNDASEAFGEQMLDQVLPYLFEQLYPKDGLIDQGSITVDGKLNHPRFSYLQDYVDFQEK